MKKIYNLGNAIKQSKLFKYIGILLLIILFFDKLFIVIVITIIAQFKKISEFSNIKL